MWYETLALKNHRRKLLEELSLLHPYLFHCKFRDVSLQILPKELQFNIERWLHSPKQIFNDRISPFCFLCLLHIMHILFSSGEMQALDFQ